jgi:hypothetical protein
MTNAEANELVEMADALTDTYTGMVMQARALVQAAAKGDYSGCAEYLTAFGTLERLQEAFHIARSDACPSPESQNGDLQLTIGLLSAAVGLLTEANQELIRILAEHRDQLGEELKQAAHRQQMRRAYGKG